MINGTNGSKLLFWILGVAIMILFAAVGLLVGDIRGDIEANSRVVHTLERQILKIEGDLKEEQRLTQEIRQWYLPRLLKLEEMTHALQRSKRLPEEGR